MRVHTHTKFCFLCVLTFLFHQCCHCHGDGHHHHQHGHHHDDHHPGDHEGHTHAHNDLQISQTPYVGGTPSPGSKSSLSDNTLEEEQRFYIQQLFRRYGQLDRLDFRGFQSLLLSLGLGEVKVVGLEHEELGHDHVAHLDVLEVQEGLHYHSPTHESHHGHGHGHGHGKANTHHHSHTEQVPTRPSSPGPYSTCVQHGSGASPTVNSDPPKEQDHKHEHHHDHEADHIHDSGHDTDHNKHDHDHDHNHDPSQLQERDPTHDHVHDHHEQDKGHKPDMDQPSLNQKDSNIETQPHEGHDHDHDHNYDHNQKQPPLHRTHENTDSAAKSQEQPTAEPPRAPQGLQPEASAPETAAAPVPPTVTPIQPPGTRAKRPQKANRRNKNQQRTTTTSSPTTTPPGELNHDHDPGHDHGHGHSHSNKGKREAPGMQAEPTVSAPALPGHSEGGSHQHEECLNLTQLLSYYGLSSESLISPAQFTYLCPALLYQIDSRLCIRHYHQVEVEQAALEPVNTVWIWVWGFVSITIISLLSLLGVVLVPILNQSFFKFLLTFLVALAVGTLSGDALLHLLPHAQGQHDHSKEGGAAVEEDLLTAFDGVWKGLTALGGIYLLFIIEHCLGMFQHYKDQGGTICGRKKKGEEAKIGRKLSDHKLNRHSDAEWLHLKPLTEAPDTTVISCDNGHNDSQLTELQPLDSTSIKLTPADTQNDAGSGSPVKENGRRAKKHGHSHGGHGHSHGGQCHSDQEMKDAGIASIAWMVIMGDGMHNFSDGLAIGAAFSANITGGISTSVAVFCHELPHELGDFAVLIKAGMSVKQAIVYNLLSALMAYLGMIIGTAVGQYTHNVTSWIFAVTAGMFLYVALVDMLPEMLHGDSEDHKRCQLGHFVLQNCGMLTGFTIMLLIAIFEDQIVLDFGF